RLTSHPPFLRSPEPPLPAICITPGSRTPVTQGIYEFEGAACEGSAEAESGIDGCGASSGWRLAGDPARRLRRRGDLALAEVLGFGMSGCRRTARVPAAAGFAGVRWQG